MIDFRPMRYEDLKGLNQVRNLSREWLHDPREFSLKETQEWWQNTVDNGEGPDYWSIIDFDNDLFLGYFRVSMHWDWGHDDDWVIGADLHPEYRGKGIAKQLYPEFMRMAIRGFDAQNFYLRVMKHNLRAGKLYVSLGFEQTEETARDIIMHMSAERFREIYG